MEFATLESQDQGLSQLLPTTIVPWSHQTISKRNSYITASQLVCFVFKWDVPHASSHAYPCVKPHHA